MAEYADKNQGDNGYINIPVCLFQTYYDIPDDSSRFACFIVNILAWGFATKQVADFNVSTSTIIEMSDNGVSNYLIDEWNNYITKFNFPISMYVKHYQKKNECTNTCHSAMVGITFTALRNMITLTLERKSKREKTRLEHCWLIYLALKSIIGKSSSTKGKRTWDNILNRALGCTSLTENPIEGSELDWTAQYRCGKGVQSRKKMDVIKRLTQNWGIVYSPKDPKTGRNRFIPWFGIIKRGFHKNVNHK